LNIQYRAPWASVLGLDADKESNTMANDEISSKRTKRSQNILNFLVAIITTACWSLFDNLQESDKSLLKNEKQESK
jgi:hypothetical protein